MFLTFDTDWVVCHIVNYTEVKGNHFMRQESDWEQLVLWYQKMINPLFFRYFHLLLI